MDLHNLLIRAQSTVDFPIGLRFFLFLHSHCRHVIDMLIKFGKNHIHGQALLKCMHVHCLSILTEFSTFFYICRVMK